MADTLLTSTRCSSRLRRSCAKGGIVTIQQLAAKRPDELLILKNFGQSTLREAIELLQSHGLELAGQAIDEPRPTGNRGELARTLDFTLTRLEVVGEHMRGNNLYAAGEAFAELRAALKRQRALL